MTKISSGRRIPSTRAGSALLALALALSASACGAPEGATDPDVAGVQAELTFANVPGTTSPFLYDAGRQCNLGWGNFHCCPPGMAITGAHLGRNVFKCAALDGGFSATNYLSQLQRNGMLSCQPGLVAYGYYGGSSPYLACGVPAKGKTTFEYIDGGTQDGYPMHVCSEASGNPYRYAISGIHASDNKFACSY
jgi:hypothetical protein